MSSATECTHNFYTMVKMKRLIVYKSLIGLKPDYHNNFLLFYFTIIYNNIKYAIPVEVHKIEGLTISY